MTGAGTGVRDTLRPVARPIKRAAWRLRVERDVRIARRRGADLSLFHDFAPSPAGGGNQTLTALLGELGRRGVRVERNVIAAGTRACLCNSFNFDVERLDLLARRVRGARIVHRVGAVTSLYRGYDDGTDAITASINAALRRRDDRHLARDDRDVPVDRDRARRAACDLQPCRPRDLQPD